MWWLLLFPAAYILILVAFVWFSLRPVRLPVYISPGGMGTPQETIEFKAADGVLLRGWWIDAASDTVAILAHGYMVNRCELAPLAVTLWQNGISSVLFDFRRHGRSGGKRTTLGVLEAQDVAAAVSYARSRRPSARIVLIGSSMGAAASAFALGKHPFLADALVMDSAYSRLSHAVLGWWRLLGGKWMERVFWPVTLIAWPMVGFNPFKVDVAEALRKAGPVPTLVFHGTVDDLALPGEAERNEKALEGPHKLIWLSDCGHSEGRWMHPQMYERELFTFLEENGLMPQDRGLQATGSSG